MECYCCRRSVAELCPTLRNPMDYRVPGFPVLHHLLEFAQARVHWVGDAIQPSRPLSSPSPPAFNLSQHWGLFQWVRSSHQGGQSIGASVSASAFPMNNVWGLYPLGFAGLISLQSNGLSRVFKMIIWKHQFFGTQPFLWSTLTSIHDCWENQALTRWTFVGKVMSFR